MACTVAMALLGVCAFTFAGEPPSPHAADRPHDSPSLTYIDRQVGGVVRYEADQPVVRVVRPRGAIAVRPRGRSG
jgi:hypothetical protein